MRMRPNELEQAAKDAIMDAFDPHEAPWWEPYLMRMWTIGNLVDEGGVGAVEIWLQDTGFGTVRVIVDKVPGRACSCTGKLKPERAGVFVRKALDYLREVHDAGVFNEGEE